MKHDFIAQDAREQLRRWDADESIWSLEMGGIGPGYEQAIQVLAIEIVRDNIDQPLPEKTDHTWADPTVKRVDAKGPDGRYSCGGFSGAQVSVAKSLAYQWLTIGPAALLERPEAKDRNIQVSNFWPRVQRPEAIPLLTACKEAMLAIKRVSLHVEGEASKELVAIYRMLQEAVQREEEQS